MSRITIDLDLPDLDLDYVKPDDDRETFWLDPKALYRCHQQTLVLWFRPTPEDADHG